MLSHYQLDIEANGCTKSTNVMNITNFFFLPFCLAGQPVNPIRNLPNSQHFIRTKLTSVWCWSKACVQTVEFKPCCDFAGWVVMDTKLLVMKSLKSENATATIFPDYDV